MKLTDGLTRARCAEMRTEDSHICELLRIATSSPALLASKLAEYEPIFDGMDRRCAPCLEPELLAAAAAAASKRGGP